MTSKKLAGYEIEAILGEGGMGVVYRAVDHTLHRPLAIKVIRSGSLGSEARERFLKEARACSRINHPNIVTVYAAGEEDEQPYLAMELLEGKTLRQVSEEGPVPWEKALRWTASILDALDRLHQEGVVHRDLKPENIMLTPDGTVKLMDFGIAQIASSATITTEGTALGTVYYMSPEMVSGEKADPRSDVFSMGTVLYQLLTGTMPFEGEHPMAIMYAIQNEPHKPLDEFPLDFPQGLSAILDRALAKSPSDRFQKAAAFKRVLESLLRGQELTTIQVQTFGKRRLWGTVASVSGVLVVLVVTLTWFLWGRKPEGLAAKLYDLGKTYQEQGQVDLAWAEYRKAVEADPRFEAAWEGLRELKAQANRVAEYDSLVNVNVKDHPTNPVVLNELGVKYEDEGNMAEARRAYWRAKQADPDYAVPWNNLGVLALNSGELARADSLLSRAVALDTTYTAALFNLSEVKWEEYQYAEAEALLRSSIAADSTFLAGYNNLAALLLELGRREAAKEIADAGLSAGDEESARYPFLLRTRGRVAVAGGDDEEALGFFQRAAPRLPEDPLLHRHIAECYERRGDERQAALHWRIVLKSENAAERERAKAALMRLGPGGS